MGRAPCSLVSVTSWGWSSGPQPPLFSLELPCHSLGAWGRVWLLRGTLSRKGGFWALGGKAKADPLGNGARAERHPKSSTCALSHVTPTACSVPTASFPEAVFTLAIRTKTAGQKGWRKMSIKGSPSRGFLVTDQKLTTLALRACWEGER